MKRTHVALSTKVFELTNAQIVIGLPVDFSNIVAVVMHDLRSGSGFYQTVSPVYRSATI